jgi:trans-aconitate methyltransferase
MMQRVIEPELMDDPEQALAYARADFDAPHNEIIEHFARVFANVDIEDDVLDLGCGPADVTVRFARRYPRCRIDGIDGAPAMLAHGRSRIEQVGLSDRIRLLHHRLPTDSLPRAHYTTVISNSLLHHLHDPVVLWLSVKQAAAPAARIFIADLMRPANAHTARALVIQYAADEPPILQRDFYNSLRAAFTPDEVKAQLAATGLDHVSVEIISDRHLVAWGRAHA